MTNEKAEDIKGRRDFVRGLFRWAALGGLAGGTLGLMSRRRDGRQRPACINDAACRTCSKRRDCPSSEYSPPGRGPERSTKSQPRG